AADGAGAAHTRVADGVAQAPRGGRLAVQLARAAFAVVDRGQVGKIPLDARGELVRLVVTDDAQTRLAPGALPTPTRIDSEPLAETRPLGGRDQHDSDREQGNVQPAHAASLAQGPPPQNSSRVEGLDLRAEV